MPEAAPSASAQLPASETSAAFYRLCALTAWGAGLFCLLLGGILLFVHFRLKASDPWKSPQLLALKEKLKAAPRDEPLKNDIRTLDWRLRQRYFRHLALTRVGAWLLAGGTIVFLLSCKQALALRQGLPMPQARLDTAERAARELQQARLAAGLVLLTVAVALGCIGLSKSSFLPKDAVGLEKLLGDEPTAQAEAAADLPTLDEVRRNWTRFLGPMGNPLAVGTYAPVRWDLGTGEGVAWKVPVPAPGHSSPVVWSNRVFLAGGTAAKREVFCLDAGTGASVWRRAVENVPGSPSPIPEVPEATTYAAATMATDGRRVYAFFGNGDLAALTMEGQQVWAKALGPLKNAYGHAASLVTWRDRLILQLDQGASEDGKSKICAFGGTTGKVLWEKSRPVPASWATPLVIEAGDRSQIVTSADPLVISYSPRDGQELWRANCLGGEVTPSPIFAGGLVLAISPTDKLLAIRPDGQGDVTKSHIAWKSEESVPDITSPASDGNLVFTVTSGGVVTCVDLKDGKKQWEYELNLECNASPGLAGGRLYVFSAQGPAVVAEAGRQFKELARLDLGEPVLASPAFVADRIFVRGATNVFCFGPSAGSGAAAK